MCIAIYKPADKSIDKETLERCYQKNPDGCGMSYIDEEQQLQIETSMDFEEFYNMYDARVREFDLSPFFLHFRIATHGSVDEDNCHPFFIEDDEGYADKVFMHNGTITPMSGYCKRDSGSSDTVEFGKRILEELPAGWESNKAIKDLIEEYIGWSKIAVMHEDGGVTIFNEHKGEWNDGIWYSNSGYTEPKQIPFREYRAYMCDLCDIYKTDIKVMNEVNGGDNYLMCKDCIKEFKDMGFTLEEVTPWSES